MKIKAILICSFFLSGCVTVRTAPDSQGKKDILVSQMNKIRPGMTVNDVDSIVGEKTIVGFERNTDAKTYAPLTIDNPYRKEFLKTVDKAYDVFYYFTRIQKADGIIADDELTPLVFENNVLIGKGWDFLNKFKSEIFVNSR